MAGLAGQRRLIIFFIIGFVILLSFWYRPPPSIRAYAPSWTLGKTATDQEALEHIVPEFGGQKVDPIVHIEPSSTAAVVIETTSAPAHFQTTAAPALTPAAADKYHDGTSVAPAVSTAAVHTFSAPALPAVDPYTAAVSVDIYEYLHESKSEAASGGAHNTGLAKETGSVDEFAYLSASHTATAHAAATAPSGFVTSVITGHHTGSVDGIAAHLAGSLSSIGALSATPTKNAASSIIVDVGETSSPDPNEEEFGGGVWYFQGRLTDYPLPELDLTKMSSYKPHNYKGPGHETYATFLSTRNASLQDPYFLATMQLTHRLLWDSHVKSKSHPFTVFVAPHIPQPQRDYLTATGALVRELDLIEFHPTHPSEAAPRWRDMFSKLNFWAQTDFSRILYLDTDAFPINPIDELWEIAHEQTCVPDLLAPEDQLVVGDICDYSFSAAEEGDGFNAGMLILRPNMAMHTRLLRESKDQDKFDQTYLEQAFLNEAFHVDGPFPVQVLPRKWNAIFTKPEDEGTVNVVHEKLWAMWFTPEHFAANYFRENWNAMLNLYSTPEWQRLRAQDGSL